MRKLSKQREVQNLYPRIILALLLSMTLVMLVLIFIAVDRSDATRSEALIVQSLVTAVTLGVVIVLVLRVLLRRLVTRPLEEIAQALQAASAGDLSRQVEVRRNDEIGRLASSFNAMASELRQTLTGLEKRTEECAEALTKAQALQIAQASELDKAKHMVEEANRLKTQFLAGMSHELRTPLNAIINFTKFMSHQQYGTLNDAQRDFQRRVLQNGEHMLTLINEILDVSKIEAGRLELFCEEIDVVTLLKGVHSTAIRLAKDKNLDIILDSAPNLPPVWIDKTRIRQVLLNLLSNAVKHTPHGTITIRANAVKNGLVCLSVQDEGTGIAPEHHDLVFQEFQQLQGETQYQPQGTGLGLPLCKRLVEMHGGQIWLESEPGKGSTFSFTILTVREFDDDERD
jgi:signal transduction histidine kinase